MINLPKAVFFDWDGTLVDSFQFLHAAHNYARKSLGMDEFSIEVFSGYFGQPREKLYAEIYGEHHMEARTLFEEFVFSKYKEHLKPLPFAKEVLQWFYDAGIPCGVVSNKKKELIEAEIVNYRWDDYFIALVGAGEAEADKPSPAPLALAIERARLSFAPEDVWYIGDTSNDLGCSNAYGAISVFIETEEMAHKLSKQNKIHLHKENLSAFYDFLLQYDLKEVQTGA